MKISELTLFASPRRDADIPIAVSGRTFKVKLGTLADAIPSAIVEFKERSQRTENVVRADGSTADFDYIVWDDTVRRFYACRLTNAGSTVNYAYYTQWDAVGKYGMDKFYSDGYVRTDCVFLSSAGSLYKFNGTTLIDLGAHEALDLLTATVDGVKADIENLKADFDTVIGGKDTDGIDNFRELISFLSGIKDDESLVAKLTATDTRLADLESDMATALESTQKNSEGITEQQSRLDTLSDGLTDLEGKIGQPDGIAPLDGNGTVPLGYLPREVIEVREFDGFAAFVPTVEVGTALDCEQVMFAPGRGQFVFLKEAKWYGSGTCAAPEKVSGSLPEKGHIYIDTTSNRTYRWSGSEMTAVGAGLGHTADTALPGDEGQRLIDDVAALQTQTENTAEAVDRLQDKVAMRPHVNMWQLLGTREAMTKDRAVYALSQKSTEVEIVPGLIIDYYDGKTWQSAQLDVDANADKSTYTNADNWKGFGSGSTTGNVVNVHEISNKWEPISRGDAALLVPADLRTGGRKITFSTAAGVWQTWQYIGTTADNWTDETYWKPEVKSISFNGGLPQVPDRDGTINLEYQVDVDESLDNESENPVQNKAVVSAINEIRTSIPQKFAFDAATRQLSMQDSEGNAISSVTIPGGDGGVVVNPTAVELTVTSPMSATVKEGDPYVVECQWRHYNINSGDETQYGGAAELIVNGSTVDRVTAVKSVPITFEVGKWLGVGANTIRIRFTADDGVIAQSAYIRVSVVTLSLTSPYTISTATPKGTAIPFRYIVSGSGEKTVHFRLDGTELDPVTLTTSGATSVKTITTDNLSHGSHRLEVYAQRQIDSAQTLTTATLAYDLIVTEESATDPIIAVELTRPTVSQYETIEIPYAIYAPGERTAQVAISLGGRTLQTSTVDRVVSRFTYRAKEYGELAFTFKVGAVTKDVTINVTEAETQISAETDALALYLTSSGRSNDADDADNWEFTAEDGTHTVATFTDCHFDAQSGWLRDGSGLTALHLEKGAHCYIPLNVFATDCKTTGKTIEIEFMVSNCYDTEATLISCKSENVGFEIKAQEAYMTSALGKRVESKFKQDERIRVGFVVEQIGGNRFMYLFLNGKMSGVVQYDTSDYFVQNPAVGISMGHASCELNVYNIRVYDNALSFRQMVSNYIADMDDTATMFAKLSANDILNEDGGEGDIDYEKAVEKIPCITFIGELPTYKGDKKKNTKIIYEDRQHPEFSFTLDKAQNDVQGTSSQYYPRKNWKWKALDVFNMTQSGQSVKKYALRGVDGLGNAVKQKAVKTFCLKADFAESSGTHNTGAANFFHEVLYNAGIHTPMQDIDPTVRTTIYGFPVLMFHQESETAPRKFIGKYNFNNDKSTHDTFGFQDIEGWNKGMVNRDDYLVWNGSLASLQGNADALNAAQDDDEYLLYLIDDGEADPMTNHLVEYDRTAGAWKDKGEMWRWSAEAQAWTKRDGSKCTRDQGIMAKVDAGELVENNVECWEFLNNGHPMCLFHASDYTTQVASADKASWLDEEWLLEDADGKHAPYWAGAFEPRYPDNDDNNRQYARGRIPAQLKRVTDWLYSLDIYNENLTDEQKKAKGVTFAAEIEGYFNKRMMLAYDILRELVVAADQGAKNMMWAIIDGKVYIIFYDNDTIWLINNEGRLQFIPYVEPHDKDSLGKFVFNGESSNLWNLIENSSLQSEKLALYNSMASGGMTYQRALLWFNTRQSDMWSETVYNADSKYKYIDSFGKASEDGSGAAQNYLDIAQGSREEHRKWAMYERTQYLNAKYCTGTYRNSYVYLRANTAGESSVPSKVEVTVKAAQDWYYGFRFSGNAGYSSQFVKKGESVTFTAPADSKPNDTETYVHQADRISDLGDLSVLYPTTLQVTACRMLERLVVGNKTEGYIGKLSTLTLATPQTGGAHPLMKSIQLANIPTLTGSLDLSGCSAIEEIEAQGTGITAVTLPAGSPIRKMHLPETLVQIKFDRLPALDNPGLVIDGYSNVATVDISDCPRLNAMSVIDAITAGENKLTNIRVAGVRLQGSGQELIRLINLGVHGAEDKNGKPEIIGTYQLTKLIENAEMEFIRAGINPDGFTLVLSLDAFITAIEEVNAEASTETATVDTVTFDNIAGHLRYYNGETYEEYVSRVAEENRDIHDIINQ